MRAEARLLTGLGFRVAIGGGMPAGARAAAERLLDAGVPALISFGLAGGLDPRFVPGSRVVPAVVLQGGRHFSVDPDLARRLGGVSAPLLVASEAPVTTVQGKTALFAATGAVAVDLESGAVAEAAARRDLPFAVLRIICDPAWRDLPPAAIAGLDSAGGIVLLPLLVSLLRGPGQIPALLRLAADARTARRALVISAKHLGNRDGED
ncbi:MAG: hypothetical protein NT133_16000 [Alphaproteobacteria bacterium]|nr:hypothetical protein [Alphaproteobacteria bacterium]